ncbi:MAG: DNA-formamidopyrimidine glycosylase [Candidatus Marinimicrobia bacterium]|nr:DNA-formamidopyrimidine glycosylase [Candidatus Neomarinimicrobiota bacterium]MCF7839806.1 DNA-formamidopyrimidine glycosylase [Candidatus Neomarinimicrobiota bacterium]MCF7901840.1 DNA-formamidopyrimidine glycosylase [Candidatus Neomarinimicrobiota bacterium]
MPELPEVETVVRSLQPDITREVIQRVTIQWHKTVADPRSLPRMENQAIRSVSRRGKFILLNLDPGAIVIHLRMTGRLYTHTPDETQEPYVTAVFHFQSGKKLYFQDTRKFGRIYFTTDAKGFFHHLGPEPLSQTFTAQWLTNQLHNRHRQIKPLLLDQAFLVGLGNIYVDEALFRAGVHPLTPSDRIPSENIQKLHRVIRTLLRNAIDAQGTTIINFQHGDNRSGSFQHQLKVYGRSDQPCPKCKTPIRKMVIGQRGTHYCPACQIHYE